MFLWVTYIAGNTFTCCGLNYMLAFAYLRLGLQYYVFRWLCASCYAPSVSHTFAR